MDNLQELLFPEKGIDRSQEVSAQPEGTTHTGKNVRLREMLTERNRGGSRAGITKFINERVSGVNSIQHLNFIVSVDPAQVGVGGGYQPNSDNPPGDVIPTPTHTITLIPVTGGSLQLPFTTILTATVTVIATGLPAAGVTVRINTTPTGRPNDGDSGTTDALGVRSFTVGNDAAGVVVYTAYVLNGLGQIVGTSNTSTITYF